SQFSSHARSGSSLPSTRRASSSPISSASAIARASSTSNTGACSSRRAPRACTPASSASRSARSGCAPPIRAECASSAPLGERQAVKSAVGTAAQGLVRLPVWRARFVLFALLAAFAALVARAVYLQAMRTDFLQERGDARYSRVLDIPATRGRILDRNGE